MKRRKKQSKHVVSIQRKGERERERNKEQQLSNST
jgi:hypothetical protein